VVHGEAGLDEISTFGRTFYAELVGGIVTTGYLVPGDVGIVESSPDEVSAGANAEENAEILQRVFSGSDRARTDLIAINAGEYNIDAYWTGEGHAVTISPSNEYIKQIKVLRSYKCCSR
jgi:anthranilate phosphoribosyltransferase